MVMIFNFILYVIVFIVGLIFGICLVTMAVLTDKYGVKELKNMVDNQEESLRLEVRDFFDLIYDTMRLWANRNDE